MPLNISKGNMYPFVTHTFNTVKGKCPHGCSYCYMKRFPQNDIRLDRKELKTDLGNGNFIFVGSSCDMWAEAIPKEWILETLDHCHQFENKYLFQSKNPDRMLDFIDGLWIPPDSILGATIETNRIYPPMGKTPTPQERSDALVELKFKHGFSTMVTVEPIMDFDLVELKELIISCEPQWVNIGADSKGHNLPEPGWDKIMQLLDNLKYNEIEIKIKDNLKRLN